MKKVIGIVPSCSLGDMTKSCMSDHYRVGNNYIKRVTEAGGIAVGVAPVDGWLPEDALELFDGYVVQGGPEFYPITSKSCMIRSKTISVIWAFVWVSS